MLEAGLWGFVGGAALLIGALIGIYLPVSMRLVGLVLAFGAGVLVSALSFELTLEAYESAGAAATIIGLAAGSLTFFAGDLLIDRRGGDRRKNPEGMQAGAASGALVLGALLDGVPESAAIGVSLIDGGRVGVTVVAAVFLSNVPESMAASSGMKASGKSATYILLLWVAVTTASVVAAVLGFGLLSGAGPGLTAVVEAFAAGAILTMLADTMLPEAVRYAGPAVGVMTVVGFACAFLLAMA